MVRASQNQKASQGYIALIAVLIIGAAATSISLALLSTGADSQRSGVVALASKQALSLAVACAEEGLQQIHDNTAFTGTNTLTMGQGNCNYTVTNTGGANRTNIAVGNVGYMTRKIQVYVTINSSNISITSWQELGF